MARRNKPRLVEPGTAHIEYGLSRVAISALKDLRETDSNLASDKERGRKTPVLSGSWQDGSAGSNLAIILQQSGQVNNQTELGPLDQGAISDYFRVDPTSTPPEIAIMNGADLVIYRDLGVTPVFRFRGNDGALITGSAATPTIAPGAALGSGGSVGAAIAWGNDFVFMIALTVGTSGFGPGVAATVTFNQARANTSYGVVLAPHSAAAFDIQAYASSTLAAGPVITFRQAPASGASIRLLAIVGGT
jgi:hypothetical protein